MIFVSVTSSSVCCRKYSYDRMKCWGPGFILLTILTWAKIRFQIDQKSSDTVRNLQVSSRNVREFLESSCKHEDFLLDEVTKIRFFIFKSLVKLILILFFSSKFRSARISRHSSVVYAVRQPRKWTGHSNPVLNDILDSKYYPIGLEYMDGICFLH